jgi:DNA-binding transcriptional ArsR family regulator
MVNQPARGRTAQRTLLPKRPPLNAAPPKGRAAKRLPPKAQPPLDRVFSALADPTRRAMVGRLAHGECTVTDLARPFPISLPAISKHLKILERAGLVERRIEGRIHHCRLAPQPLQDATEWLQACRAYWEQRLDALEEFLLSKRATPANAPAKSGAESE